MKPLTVICSWCKRTKVSTTKWEKLPEPKAEERVSHGICPTCHAAQSAQILRNRTGIGSSVGGAV